MIQVFENFMPTDLAENLLKSINETPANWWKTSVLVDRSRDDYKLYDNSVGQYKDHEVDIRRELRANHFCYMFKRSVEHYKTCDCRLCQFDVYLDNVLKQWIENHTDLKNLTRTHSFASVYEPGHFLATHTDDKRGDVAFVINLTKDWRPEYGGVFHCEGEYIVPKFNSLMIMTLPNGGRPHFVSEVSQRAPHPRIAVSGWFKEQSLPK